MPAEGKSFTPRELVTELDRYIVGQHAAKKAVAIALRNRWRRQQIEPQLREEIMPKNIILMGPTGCGKTEIARRLAKLADAPFVKVEATKFTEVGYVGRDVDSMVRDLIEVAVKMCKEKALQMVQIKAQEIAEEQILDLLVPASRTEEARMAWDKNPHEEEKRTATQTEDTTREKMRQWLREGKLDLREVTIEIKQTAQTPMFQLFGQSGMEEMATHLQDTLQTALGGGKKKRRKMGVKEALEVITTEEAHKLVDLEQIHKDAIIRAEQFGIIFIDEIDKIAGREGGKGPDVSREGVQRDILPIVEGSAVSTKYGVVKTDHVLFIAAGAFHMSKPSDLIPELQGRFPIRVELESLTEEDFIQILKEPENSLVKQYTALLQTEGIELTFTQDGLEKIAHVAAQVNATQQNIGARRLYTVMEKLLEEENFHAPERKGVHIRVNAETVHERLVPIMENEDFSKFIL